MAQQLRAHTVLAEVGSSGPRTNLGQVIAADNHSHRVSSIFGYLNSRAQHTHITTHRNKKGKEEITYVTCIESKTEIAVADLEVINRTAKLDAVANAQNPRTLEAEVT